jgi:biopolymer transport protein ExbD
MPLVLDAERLPRATLQELACSLRNDLEETRELIVHPRGRVVDPASLETARELLDGALAVIDRPGPRETAALAADANLAYATMVAVIDLVKSHTDVPRVPAPRP